jgi:hypothetical protein
MPEDAKWNVRWAKDVVECEEHHYASRPQSKVHIQSWNFVSYCGISVQGHKQIGSTANIKVYPTFHVSLLKPFVKETLWPNHK